MSVSTAALLLHLALVAPESAAEAPPTMWSASGARPWTLCQTYEVEAARRLRAGVPPGDERNLLRQWGQRIISCPHVPAALVLTALLESGSAPKLDPSVDFIDSLPELDAANRQQRERILELLRRAQLETRRRGEELPSPARYLAAYAAVGLGDPARAKPLIAHARRAAEVDSWRIDRLDALIALSQGDLHAALRFAHRAQIHSSDGGRPASTYVLALVLDRSGSIAAARDLLADLRVRDGRTLGGLISLMPLRDRLYLMALDQEARGHRAGAYTLWQAYLERDDVEDPEREQVRRRLIELRPAVTIADG